MPASHLIPAGRYGCQNVLEAAVEGKEVRVAQHRRQGVQAEELLHCSGQSAAGQEDEAFISGLPQSVGYKKHRMETHQKTYIDIQATQTLQPRLGDLSFNITEIIPRLGFLH